MPRKIEYHTKKMPIAFVTADPEVDVSVSQNDDIILFFMQ